jgi:hypothetical protein
MQANKRGRGRPRTIEGVPTEPQIPRMTIKDIVPRKPLTATLTIADMRFQDGEIPMHDLPNEMHLFFHVSQGMRITRATPPVQLMVSMAKSFCVEGDISADWPGGAATRATKSKK